MSVLPARVARALQPMHPPHGHSQLPSPGFRSSHLGVGQGDLGLQFLHLFLQLFLLFIHALPVATFPLEVLLKDLHLEGRWRGREEGMGGAGCVPAAGGSRVQRPLPSPPCPCWRSQHTA